MVAIAADGSVAAGASSNGAIHKIPGRVGDAAVPGGGAYADSEVGGCGSTGDGDTHLAFLPCFTVVELMRQGRSPQEAAEEAVQRMARRRPGYVGAVVAASRDGSHGAAAFGWSFAYSVVSPATGCRVQAVWATSVCGVGVAQLALAASISGVVGAYLTGEFEVDDAHTATCGLSMHGSSVCTAAFVGTAVSVVLSLLMMAMQCAAVDGRAERLAFCGPILSAIGFFWWLAYGAAATSAQAGASHWQTELATYRAAVVGMSWGLMCLFIVSFFLSSASASAAARERAALEEKLAGPAPSSKHPHHAELETRLAIKMGAVKRFNQPLASQPSSPSKSSARSFASSVFDPFSESEAPKKWVQPSGGRKQWTITSDGLRTLVLLDGEPVPLSVASSPAASSPAQSPFQGNSPAISPSHSPMARDHSPSARSPLSRCASGAGGGSPFARAPMALRLQLLRQEGAAGSGASSLGRNSSRGVGSFRHMFSTPREEEQGQQAQQQQQQQQP
ncbi:hypothetical protein COHA_006827 [Chlorella ohadii]|uniref:beta-aspartyl-peptidase n=1 Tax=Chlorella ohadii TaxID=2649997 RepID=A0AAD5DM11_9CHLO|nr:hypothetical protein COHA_006827 [Chlorella ohadii]